MESKNYNRIESIDLLRGLAIILMIWAHFMWWLVNRRIIYIYLGFGIPIDLEFTYSGIPQFLNILSNYYPVPVFFMFTGISLVLSIENKRSNNINDSEIRKYVIKRTLFILVISYFVFNLIIKGPLSNFYQSWDMLQLIGGGGLITYCLLKFAKKFRFIIAFIIIILTPFIQIIFNYNTLHYNYPAQGGIISNIIFSGEFPLFPWLSFVILGSIIGELLNDAIQRKNIIQFLKKISILGFISIIFGCLFPLFNIPTFTTFEKYPCTIPYILFFTGTVLISLSICYYIFDYRKKGINLFKPIINYGTLSLTIFIGHYFIGYRVTKILGIYENFSYGSAAILTLSFYFICWVFLIIWSNFQYKLSLEWIMKKFSYKHFEKKKKNNIK